MKIIFAIVPFFLLSCTEPTDSNALLFGLDSYASVGEVRIQLEKMDAAISVIENSSVPRENEKPRFDIMMIRVTGLLEEAVDGVFLSFYNDRLLSIRFYVNDLKEIGHVFTGIDKQFVALGTDSLINATVRLTIEKERDGLILVLCEDIGLGDEKWDWIKKHG